jgi:hypothetical protein
MGSKPATGAVTGSSGITARVPGTKGNEECPYYERGFCKLHWMNCQLLHSSNGAQGFVNELCPNYMIGFCPKGPNCELIHLKLGVVGDSDTTLKTLANFPDKENWSDKNAIQVQPPPMSMFAKNM